MSEPTVASELVSRLPGLDRLWAITKGRSEIVIAVLDGPVDRVSAAGQGHLAPSGTVEHGTHVHSIIAGSADARVPGLAPGCTIFSVPIFAASTSSDQQTCTQEELAAGIRTALDRKANIINISASQQTDLLALSHELSGALQAAAGADTLVVAAAGNQGCACDTIPASVAGVLAVGARNEAGDPLLSSKRPVPRHWLQLRHGHGVGHRRPADEHGCRARRQAERPPRAQGSPAILRHAHPTRSKWPRRICPGVSTYRVRSTSCRARPHLSTKGRGGSP